MPDIPAGPNAGVGSPASCPSAAPESTQSPKSPPVAPVYRSGVERPAGTLSALREQIARAIARRAGSQAFDHTDRAWDDLRNRWLTYADAVLAVRDDELDRLRREVAYVAETGERWRQLWETVNRHRAEDLVRAEQAEAAIARVRELADRLCQEPHPTHDHMCPDGLRAELLAALDGAGAVPEHTGSGND